MNRRGPGRLADRVAHGVAEDRRDGEQQAEQPDVEHARRGGEQSRGDEQRVAGQKEADEQPRFGEDDRREADVAAPGDDAADVAKSVKQVEQRLHSTS